MRSNKLKFKILTSLILLSISSPVLAGRIYFASQKGPVRVGDYLQIVARIDTENASINAVETQIKFSPNTLSVEEIYDGNSVLNLWLARPKVDNGSGLIELAGLVPGGLTVQDGILVTILFKAVSVGQASIKAEGARMFLNTENAEETEIMSQELNFNIITGVGDEPLTYEKPAIPDFAPPEKFSIDLARSSDVFGGGWFISFNAQDKRSGINRYEIKESPLGLFGHWEPASSPYLLSDQKLISIIRIKAVDHAGHQRIAVLIPNRLLGLYILLTLFVLTALNLKPLWRFFKKREPEHS